MIRFLAVALLCAVLFAPGAGSLPPVDRDEPRYAQASRQMLESGDWIDIRFQDQPRYKKPAGIYWLQAVSAAAFGRPGTAEIWPFRIPSLLGAAAAVLLTAWTGAQLFSPNAGALAAVFLAASLLLNVQARLATTDAALLACAVAAFGALARAHGSASAERRRDDLLFWGALGAGVLIKGPIILLAVAGTLLVLLAVERRAGWLRRLTTRRGVALMLAIAAPWLAAIALVAGGDFFAGAVGGELLGRVLVGQQAHGAPPGYHLAAFPLAFWPFSLLAGLALPWVWAHRRRPEVRFCIAWIVPTWILFELVVTKLPHYVLPVYPAIALLTAAAAEQGAIAATAAARPRFTRVLAAVWVFLSLLIAVLIATAPLLLERRPDAVAIATGAVLAAAAPAAGILVCRARLAAAVAVVTVAALVVCAGAFGMVFPRLESLWLSRRAAELVERVRPCRDTTVAAVGFHEPSLVFLLGRATKLVGVRGAARHLLADPACSLALLPPEDGPQLAAILDRAGVVPVAVGQVDGIGYSNGKRWRLTLYAAASREP
jgi:4-amino-4-deoxy-L-arabinose transferase-like glycosyltransferase